MSEESKTTYLFGDSRNTLDPNLMLAMNGGGGFGGNGMWNNPIWAIVFLAALRNGGIFGNGDGNGNGNCSTAFVSSQLGQAIAGNANAISNLATHLDCSVGQIQSGLNALQSSIQAVGNQVGMSGQQIINAVNSGDSMIANQLQQCCCTLGNQITGCCCEVKDSITRQGYENQLATLNQTNVLGSKIDAQTTFLADKFCELEKRELQNRIEALRESNTALKGQIDNANQTAAITGYINQLVSPLAQEVAGIKCKLPETRVVPDAQGVYLSPCQATLLGLGGNGLGYPYGINNGGNGIFG